MLWLSSSSNLRYQYGCIGAMSTVSKRPARHRTSSEQNTAILGTSLHLVLITLLIFLALLREQPSFWLNAGGWSIWLRNLVETGFYSLFSLELMLLSGFSVLMIVNVQSAKEDGAVAIVCLSILWILYLVIVLIVVANNLENIVAGRPAHWHP